jgi:ABC-type multidrug transport system, ATPase component
MKPASVIIQTNGLTKVYGGAAGKKAVDAVTFAVERGEIFGFLGPNGAGKTTTIRLILDLLRPTQGEVHVFGLHSIRDSVAIRQRIGYLPGELNLWNDRTALQIIQYCGKMRGKLDMHYVHELAERLDFDMTRKIRTYSTGNKRKLGLILALMNRPELLILDEPTTGLDPLMQQTFITLMREARAAGQTIFLSSHMLSEVQAICDRVGIIREGRLRAVERVEKLTHVDFRWVSLRFREPVAADLLAHLPGAAKIETNGRTIRLRYTGDFDPLLRAISPYYVENLQVQEPTLEEIFLSYYNNNGEQAGSRLAAPEMEAVS